MTLEIDKYRFARYIREAREALNMNHRELAEAIKEAGGAVTYQGVQQWENTDDEQRTTWPRPENLAAIAKAIRKPLGEVTDVWTQSRAARPVTLRQAVARVTRGGTMSFDTELRAAILEKLPDSADCIDRSIAPFGVHRRYDYLSPKVAMEWVVLAPREPYFKRMALESRLWRLMWLARLDAETGVQRSYAVFMVAPEDHHLDEPIKMKTVKQALEELGNELRLFNDLAFGVGIAVGAGGLAEQIAEMENEQSAAGRAEGRA